MGSISSTPTLLYKRLKMIQYLLPCTLLVISSIIFWFKGNAKDLFGIEWGPFEWWIYTSLATNYMTLISWWKLLELGDVWKAGVIWGVISLFVDLTLNSWYYGFNWKGLVAMCLCACAAIIIHN
jgi:hypothetical protein